MEKSIKIRKILMFVGTGAAAYLVMHLLGQGSKAWETVRGNVTQQLTVLLSGGLAGAFAMLIPSQNKPATPEAPATPRGNEAKQAVATDAVSSTNPEASAVAADAEKISKLETEVQAWRDYGSQVNGFHAQQESLRVLLDTRQAMLRITLGSIVVLAFVVSLFSTFAPPLPQEVLDACAQDSFMKHLAWLAMAHCLVGLIIGAVIFRIRIHTLGRHAFRAAAIAAFVMNLSAMLVVIPYLFALMWQQKVQLFGIMQPMLVWTTAFRIFIAPFLCGIVSLGGFHLAKLFSRS
jgi:hypothetical protein